MISHRRIGAYLFWALGMSMAIVWSQMVKSCVRFTFTHLQMGLLR